MERFAPNMPLPISRPFSNIPQAQLQLFSKLSIKLHQQSYKKTKYPLLPLNPDETKFATLDEAIMYVKRWLEEHNERVTMKLIQEYLPHLYIYDPYLDAYVQAVYTPKKDLVSAFKRVGRK